MLGRRAGQNAAEGLAEVGVLVGRSHGHPNPAGRSEARGRANDHSFLQKALEERPRVLSDLGEDEVRDGGADRVEPVLAQRLFDLRPAVAVGAPAALDLRFSSGRGEARDRGDLSGRGDVEGAAHLANRRDHLGRSRRIADAEAREPEDLREGAEDDDAPATLEVLLDPVGIVRLLDVLEVRLVEDGDDVVGNAIEVVVQ